MCTRSLLVLLLTPAATYGDIFSSLRVNVVCAAPAPPAWPVSKIVPNILVYTRNKKLSFRVTSLDEIGSKINELEGKDYLKAGRQVVFIVHGFWNNELFNWQYKLKTGVLEADDSTVFIVTWGRGAITPLYAQAGANTQTVATVVSTLANEIAESGTFKDNPKSLYLYCIGHSLGGQICGQAGRLSGRFNRVTGLDPAGPGFENCWSDKHVDTRSATCVDHIHTDGTGKGHISPLGLYYGTLNAWGHVDFYPNGGKAQTGCNILKNDAGCSHLKSIDYFIYSIIKKDACVAKQKCSDPRKTPQSCEESPGQQMGYYSSCYKGNRASQPGLYYLTTNANSPYC